MPLKLLPNQWSVHFEKCFLCGTSSKEGRLKHASKGVCLYCYKKLECMKHKKGIARPRKWYKNYWEKIRNDPVAKKRYQEHCRNWRKTSKVFKRYLKRRNAKIRHINYIKKKERQRKQWIVIKLIDVLNDRIRDSQNYYKQQEKIKILKEKRFGYAQYIIDYFNGDKIYISGIQLNFEHEGKEYKIIPPFKNIIGNEKDFDLFMGELKRYFAKLSTYGGIDGG